MPEPTIIPLGSPFTLRTSDPGIAHGYGLFETIRLKRGRLLLWSAHWQRLITSADALGLQCNYSEDSVLRAIGRLLQWDALEDATIKLSLLREGRGDQLYVYARPSLQWPGTARLQWLPQRPLAAASPLAGHKTHNYMENIYLLEQARAAGFDDCLRPAPCGSIGETTVANLFWLRGDVLHTPSTRLGILPGVVRATLLRLAPSLDIPCQEDAFHPESLNTAESLFIANASIGLLPVHSIEGPGINQQFDSAAHPVYDKLRQALQREQEHTAPRPPVPENT